MESREEKFKKYREEIAQYDNKNEIEKLDVTPDVLEKQEEDTVKKNTLTMSIDQIIEAHDEYTMIIHQKELQEKLKSEKKQKRKIQMITSLKYLGIGLVLLIILIILVIIIIHIL